MDYDASRARFAAVETHAQLCELWASFYVAPPGERPMLPHHHEAGYLGESNVLATPHMAAQFARLARGGVLCTSSQCGSVEHRQRAYIIAFVEGATLAHALVTRLNAHSGVVAYAKRAPFDDAPDVDVHARFKKEGERTISIGVTYVGTEPARGPAQLGGSSFFTSLPVGYTPTYQHAVADWLGDAGRADCCARAWWELYAVDAVFERDTLLDTLVDECGRAQGFDAGAK